MINVVTAGLLEQEINVTQSWPGILKWLYIFLKATSSNSDWTEFL